MKACLIALILLGFGFQAHSQSTPSGLEGTWQGTLEAGAQKLRLVLTVTKTDTGEFTSVLDSVDQGSIIPADKTTVQGSKVRIEFERVGGVYEGVLNQALSEMTGMWTQGGAALPLLFKRESAESAPAAKPASPAKFLEAPIDVSVRFAPTAFQSDGKTHLVYELHVTNFSPVDLLLTGVDVLDQGGKLLRHYEQADLVASVALPGAPATAGMNKLRLGPGRRAVVYMWVTLTSPAAVPSALKHRVTVKAGENGEALTVLCAPTQVGHDLAVLAPPLRGDNWEAGNGPSNTSGHRRALIPVGGRAHIAQRFAIDWVRLNPDGKTFTGDPKQNKNYRAYGVEALAVADGTVTEVKDGIPENIPGATSRAVPITLETVGGNHVILDIGNGRYAFYAHLQPGSLRVKLGDHVKTGQVLGLVGNSGNSTEPHLHFHLSDTNSPLASEGIPYALASFSAKANRNAPPAAHKMEIPSEDEVVTFEVAP